MKPLFVLTCFCFFLFSHTIRVCGEGTKELMPNNSRGTGLVVSTVPVASFPLGSVGSYVGCPSDQRIYFRIKDFTKENLYYGFHWLTLRLPTATVTVYPDVWMKVYDPNNNLVASGVLPTTGPGFITSWALASNGPNVGAYTGGYDPLSYKPLQNGDYYVEFFRSPDGINEIAGGGSMLSVWFDMTVAQSNNTRYPGRVHCNEWAVSVYNVNAPNQYLQNPLVSTNAQFYAYTSDSVVAKIHFPPVGFEPLTYLVAVNHNGVQNTGNWLVDRQSQNVAVWSPTSLSGSLFPVFLNQPDASLYVSSTMPNPPTLVDPTISGCPPGPYKIRFNAPQAGDYYMVLDFDGNGFVANTVDRFIELVSVAPGIVTYVWDGKNGLGATVPANTSFPIIFSFRKGRINMPFYDVEMNINGFLVDGIAPSNKPSLTLYWDDTQLSNIGATCDNTTNNNNSTGVGYANAIQGQVSPGHAWSGNGNSGFVIPAPSVGGNNTDNIQCNDFGNARLVNTWGWGLDTSITQTVKLACLSVSGTVWDDADNSTAGSFANQIRTNSEPGTNAGGGLYASLIDPVTNTVISSVPVNSNGTYTLTGCPINSNGMQVVISTSPGVVDAAAPAGACPSAWLNTSPLVRTFPTLEATVTGLDFGVEQLPNSNPQGYTILLPVLNSFMTLNGSGTISNPGPLAGSDPEDGTLGSNKKVVITQSAVYGQLYYNGLPVGAGSVITNYNPALLQIQFTSFSGLYTEFYYAYFDAAGKQDPTPARYTINFSWILDTKLTSFAVRGTDLGAVLNWTSENETDGLYYSVERSVDGANFATIGHVESTANGAAKADHTYTDNNPNGPVTYYRLKLVDKSGKVFYSNIVVLGSMPGRSAADVTPNPFRDVLNVRLSLVNAGKLSIRLLDSKGMVVREGEYTGTKGDNLFQISNLGVLPVSVYFVQIALSDRIIVQKVSNR